MSAPAARVLGALSILIALALKSPVADAATVIPGGIGPFRVELRNVANCGVPEKCNHPEKMEVANMKVARDPDNQYKYTYNADINSTVAVDDSYKTEVRVSRWSGNGWTNNVFRMTVANPCSAFKSHRPDIFKQVSDLYYDGSVTDCPLPPVSARVRDFTVEAKPPSNIKSLPYGRFRARIKLIDPNHECISCYDVVTDVLPKRRQ
ncbi:uncharacterized protein LOC113203980 isoform X1 [Frankliniella occidentalis]|uniref:Uncharacterized protein LOC113203980 isoform X1 n=1 Tax=Frankliniella occidentalis TaxID=133901 RepID=A0A6J1S0R1_FRAOC|nr:uncharacterized protein LOC113203980 isoform X1 [Frankliniella occidentalis]